MSSFIFIVIGIWLWCVFLGITTFFWWFFFFYLSVSLSGKKKFEWLFYARWYFRMDNENNEQIKCECLWKIKSNWFWLLVSSNNSMNVLFLVYLFLCVCQRHILLLFFFYYLLWLFGRAMHSMQSTVKKLVDWLSFYTLKYCNRVYRWFENGFNKYIKCIHRVIFLVYNNNSKQLFIFLVLLFIFFFQKSYEKYETNEFWIYMLHCQIGRKKKKKFHD